MERTVPAVVSRASDVVRRLDVNLCHGQPARFDVDLGGRFPRRPACSGARCGDQGRRVTLSAAAYRARMMAQVRTRFGPTAGPEALRAFPHSRPRIAKTRPRLPHRTPDGRT